MDPLFYEKEKREMAETQLHFVKYAAEEILEYISMGGRIEEWYQNKLSKVHSDMEGMHSYIEGEKRRTGMVKEETLEEATPYYNKPSFLKKMSQVAKQERLAREKKEKETKPVKEQYTELQEGRPSQRHPLEGHDYHKKSNAELVGIAKDAHKAAEAMKSHNTTAENKYRDQANDSATVRYFRQKNGMPTWYKKKYGHMKEEVEQIEELKTSTLTRYGTKAMQTLGRDPEKTDKRVKGIQTARYKVQQKNMTREETELDEANHMQMAKNIEAYAKKSGGIDKNDMMKVASMLKRGDMKGAEKYTMRLDSDPRDFLLSKMGFNEEVEQISELSMQKLTQYKTAATKSASDADKAGDYEKGNKRFAGIMKATKKQFAPNCVQFKKTMEEDLEQLEEKNVPTSPEKWAQAKAQAKAKFDVYPSAYANGWAAKKYKSMGGGWKSVNEDLRKWFDPKDPEGGWKRINSKGEAIGPCAREPGEAKPKCMSNEKRASLSKKERASAVKTKRKYDSDPDRKGSPINVSNYSKGKISEQYDDTPFDPPYSDRPSTVKDKSGAIHGPMSRAKHLAKMAMKRQAERLKDKPTMKTTQESVELKESRRAEIVREAMKVAKDKKKKESNKTDKFESEPELSTAINKTDV
jgi:hypothetical protein